MSSNPTKLKNFAFQSKIGTGNFSEVWKATDNKNYNDVAIKIMDDKQIRSQPKVLELLKTEIHVLKTIKNPNVVKLYDSFQENGRYYLILEYCNSGDLENYMKKQPNRCISEAEALGFFKQLLNGFKALHEIKAMHRDFKLANVLIHDGVLKIADLGFSKVADLAKTALGTGVYMAPEILKYQNYSNKVDIWSLGVSLYEMLFGDFPFFGKTEMALLKNIEENNINFTVKGRTISVKMQELIKKMLVVDPNKRIDWHEIYQHELLNEPAAKNQGLLASVSVYMKKQDVEKSHQNRMFEKNKDFYNDKSNLNYDNDTLQKNMLQKKKQVKESSESSSDEENPTLERNKYVKKNDNDKNSKNTHNNGKNSSNKKRKVSSSSESSDSDEKDKITKEPLNYKKKTNNKKDASPSQEFLEYKRHFEESKQNPAKQNNEEIEKIVTLKKETLNLLENKYLHWRNIISFHAKVLGDGLQLQNNPNCIYIYFILAKRILFLSDELLDVLENKKNYFNQGKFFKDFTDSGAYLKLTSLFREEKTLYEMYFDSLLTDIKEYQTSVNPLYTKLQGEFNKKLNNIEQLFKEILMDHAFSGQMHVLSLIEDKQEQLAKKICVNLVNLCNCYNFRTAFQFNNQQEAGFDFQYYEDSLKCMGPKQLTELLEQKIASLF